LSKALCNSEVQSQLLELLEKTPIPVSIEFVARHLNVGWGTARAMLLELALSGKVASQKTTKSWIFWIPLSENVPRAPNVQKAKQSG
jgi:DNA-binding IclR family transcriptional regulator